MEDLAIIGGLVAVQFVYAGNSVFLSYLMSLGFTPYTIVIFTTFATFLITTPVAILFERSKWPKELTLKLVVQLVFISFMGVTLFQSFFLKGIKLTSPALATAMPNLAPAFIFLIAWTVRLEKVNLSCVYSKVKIMGTLLCVAGAVTMSLMHSSNTLKHQDEDKDFMFDKQKVIGCLYLVAAVFVLSTNVVLQASTLGDFPAPTSLCAITSLIGVFITAIVQWFVNYKFEITWPLVSLGQLIAYSLMAGGVGGACVSFNGWAMKKRGPVLVSMFSPISTVVSVILSIFTIGDTIKIGSLAGMVLMFTGLYFVLWAKGKENFGHVASLESRKKEGSDQYERLMDTSSD
ncbi:Nodulin MtN21 /EamA-like transporter family protein [Euphorbia peplus]|nr:Nodulin MtN21 /EamA-like transporter family protein [Euphorbia peplus]